jgi:uncharacterized membrane protein YeaQ/YmgE (transglycosylase-associated protein family)
VPTRATTADRRHPAATDDATTSSAGRGVVAVRDTWTVTKRNLRHFVRQPRLLVFSTIQPIMFVVLFAFVFGGVAATALPEGVAYISFLLPGLFIQSAAFRSTQTAVGLAEDLERGVIDRFRSMPMSGSRCSPAGPWPTWSAASASSLLMVAVGYLIGFRFTEGRGLGHRRGARRRAVRLRARVAVHLPGPGRPRRRGRADRRLRARVPAGVRELDLRPVETMPSWLQGSPPTARCPSPPTPPGPCRSAAGGPSAAVHAGLGGGHPGDRDPGVGASLPPHDLSKQSMGFLATAGLGMLGSVVGGTLASLITGEGLALSTAGIIGSILGVILVLFIAERVGSGSDERARA